VKLSVERITFTEEEICHKILGGSEEEARIFSFKIASEPSLDPGVSRVKIRNGTIFTTVFFFCNFIAFSRGKCFP